MIRLFLISVGALTVFSGLLTIWLPIPIGLPLLMLGVPLLMRYSPYSRRWILRIAKVSPTTHRWLSKITPSNEN